MRPPPDPPSRAGQTPVGAASAAAPASPAAGAAAPPVPPPAGLPGGLVSSSRRLATGERADPSVITLHGVWKRYGPTIALRDLTLEVPAGRVVGLLGPNGAGKSSVLRIAAGLIRPTRGTVTIDGSSPAADGARRAIGFAGHRSFLYGALTAEENLRLYAELYGCPQAWVAAALQRFGLEAFRDHRMQDLSRGLAQRLNLARALLHGPRIVLLDEPFTGLDAAMATVVASEIEALRRAGCSVILATHEWGITRELVDEAVVLVGGRMAFSGPARALAPEELPGVFAGRTTTAPPGQSQSRGDGPAPSRTQLATTQGDARAALTSTTRDAGGRTRGVPLHPLRVQPRTPSAGRRPLLTILRKDLTIEGRTRDLVPAMALLALLLLALSGSAGLSGAQGGVIVWSAVVMAAALGLTRSFALEIDQEQLNGLRLAPVDPGWVFLGKMAANLLLVCAVEAVALAAAVVFLNLPPGSRPLALAGVLILGAAAVVSVGTLVGAVLAASRLREILLPLLVLPLSAPAVMAASAATLKLLTGPEPVTGEVILLGAFAVLGTAAGLVLFDAGFDE